MVLGVVAKLACRIEALNAGKRSAGSRSNGPIAWAIRRKCVAHWHWLPTFVDDRSKALGLALAQAQSELSGGRRSRGENSKMDIKRVRQMLSPARRPEQSFSDGVFVHAGRSSDGDWDARLFWRADLDPSVIIVEAEPVPPSDVDAFDIANFPKRADLVMDAHGRELLLLTDNAGQIQLEIADGTVGEGPVRLHYQLNGFHSIDAKLRTLVRLSAFQRLGRFPKSLFPPETAASKWVKALQAYDGMAAGASHREIASVLFGERLVQEEWNGRSDFLRLRVQRLLHYGRKMVNGGYKHLLH